MDSKLYLSFIMNKHLTLWRCSRVAHDQSDGIEAREGDVEPRLLALAKTSVLLADHSPLPNHSR